MKTHMKNIILTSALFVTTPALAGVSWVKSPFWQTAYRTNYSAELRNTNTEIAGECQTFERIFLDENYVISKRDVANFETFNELSLPSDMFNPSFYLEMKLDIPMSGVLEDLTNSELKTLTDETAKTDLIPFFTQTPTHVVLQPESFTAKIRPGYPAKSLLSMSDKLGAKPSEIKMIRRNDGFYLTFLGKDVVCDLLSGRASLTMSATVGVKISLEAQLVIQNFYSSVDTISNKVFERTASPQMRAALLGFQLGGLLAKTTSNQVAESQMLGLLTHLFDEKTMAPNNLWSTAFGEKVLSVTGTAPNQIVLLEIKGPRRGK